MTILRRLLPDRFIMLLVATVVVATLLPATGWLLSAISWASNAAIVLLFFLHGARLSRQAVLDGAKKWRLLSVILLFGYGLFPLAMWVAAHALSGRFAPELLAGLLFLGVLPTTVQSSIAYASIARGNVAASVIASAASNLLAVVVTPVLFALIASSAVAGVSLAGIGKVATLLLLPFAMGQLLRVPVLPIVQRHAWVAGNIDKMTIILAVYVAFSQAETEGLWHRIDAGALVMLAALMAGVLIAVFAGAWGIGAAMGLDRADRATLLFASAHKSLATGAPMARILFPPALAGAAILPLLLYHQMQLMLSAVVAARLAKDDQRIT
ncbi:MAG: bile acid:sodium symporter family protein [Sphingomonas sp.]